MALARRGRERGIDYWPGFVDALSTLILGIVFLLSVFVIVQFFLSQEVTGKDTALQRLNAQLAQLTEMLSLALTLAPEEATEPLLKRLRHKMAQHVLPARRLRINRREVKQIYNKYKPKKRQLPPPEPFEPEEQFLDFVDLLDPLALELPVGGP